MKIVLKLYRLKNRIPWDMSDDEELVLETEPEGVRDGLVEITTPELPSYHRFFVDIKELIALYLALQVYRENK